MLKKYIYLVDDIDQVLEPVVLGDWMAPFRQAWMPTLERSIREANKASE